MESTKLEKLLISEVSGVDDPANELPGWMVTKSKEDAYFSVASEMERFTKAADSKKPYGDVEYADPGYQEDGKKRYPLDTETHIRAAWSYINQADNADLYSAENLGKIKAKIKAAMKRIGAEVTDMTAKSDSDTNIVAKIKAMLLGAPTGKDDVDMDSAELKAILAENNEALAGAVAEAVAKSVPSPAEGEGATEVPVPVETGTETDAITAEVIQKTIEEALAPHLELFEKFLDRIVRVESALGVAAKKSLDGQEGETTETVEKSTPDLSAAIAGALANRTTVGRKA